MKKSLLMVAALTASSLSWGAEMPAEAASCVACHGANGKAIMPLYPNLAGQNQPYLVQQLKNFRDGKRGGDPMPAMSVGLSDEAIEKIATYFSEM